MSANVWFCKIVYCLRYTKCILCQITQTSPINENKRGAISAISYIHISYILYYIIYLITEQTISGGSSETSDLIIVTAQPQP